MNKKMTNEMKEWDATSITNEINGMKDICRQLMQTTHYAKMGEAGLFAILQKAKALNINPIEALNGGLYFVNGKVEMSSNMMIQLIRQSGHSVTKDKRSDDTICILHGKRKDNGDTWTENFSIEDAQRAGIYKNVWQKYPRNMLFARALSNLARQLFPDAVKGCYVEGEIQSDKSFGDRVEKIESIADEPLEKIDFLTADVDTVDDLEIRLQSFPELRQNSLDFIKKNYLVESFAEAPFEFIIKLETRVKEEEKKEEERIAEFKMDSEKFSSVTSMSEKVMEETDDN